MKNLSDEELVRLALTQAKLIPYWMEDDTRNEDELISRLARGRKAMEALDSLTKEVIGNIWENPGLLEEKEKGA